MSTIRVTKRAVDAMEAGDRDQFFWDQDLRGFGVKVTPAGRRTYVYQYRMGGRETPPRRRTIGSHGSPWTSVTARAEAERLALLVGQGIDPVRAEKEERRLAAALAFAPYVQKFFEIYLEPEWPGSAQLAKRRLEMYAVPVIGDRALHEISRGDITEVLDGVRDRPGLAVNLFAVLRKLFNWAEERGDIERTPMSKMRTPKGPKSRKRVLNPIEIVALWRATFRLTEPFGAFVRLLVCTLQRRSEVAGLSWPELSHDEQLWRLPGERAKNGVDHLVPLNELALKDLNRLEWKRRGLVITTTGETPISGFVKIKRKLDRLVLAELQKIQDAYACASGEQSDAVTMDHWVIHDIRRTGTTQMQALGVPIEVTEKVINHVSGETAGIRGVYNLYQYLPEKQQALDRWGKHLEALIASTPG